MDKMKNQEGEKDAIKVEVANRVEVMVAHMEDTNKYKKIMMMEKTLKEKKKR